MIFFKTVCKCYFHTVLTNFMDNFYQTIHKISVPDDFFFFFFFTHAMPSIHMMPPDFTTFIRFFSHLCKFKTINLSLSLSLVISLVPLKKSYLSRSSSFSLSGRRQNTRSGRRDLATRESGCSARIQREI